MSPAEAGVSQWPPQVLPHSYLESGKLITCGSTDDLGQSYVTSGKHCETPEPFPLRPEVCVQKTGWDHCVAVTESHEVYTWGWKECIPTGRVFGQVEGDSCEMNTSFSAEQVIGRAPHKFKIACLEDIKKLFPEHYNPFFAGFGNRDTDELSYSKLGIPKGNIFIINPKGEEATGDRVDVKLAQNQDVSAMVNASELTGQDANHS